MEGKKEETAHLPSSEAAAGGCEGTRSLKVDGKVHFHAPVVGEGKRKRVV